MRILFDEGTPRPLRHSRAGHTVDTVHEQGWSTLQNCVLLAKAEQAGYEIFITTDQNLRYQQNLTGRHLAIVVLCTTSWPRIQLHLTQLLDLIASVTPSSYYEMTFDPTS
jgi:hypothetical protein